MQNAPFRKTHSTPVSLSGFTKGAAVGPVEGTGETGKKGQARPESANLKPRRHVRPIQYDIRASGADKGPAWSAVGSRAAEFRATVLDDPAPFHALSSPLD